MDLIHKSATQGGEMSKPPGLRRRGNSWEIRVRVPQRVQTKIQKTEIVKSFGDVSFREACRRGWLERAALEQRFQLAEAETDNGSAQPFTDVEIADLAMKFLKELEQSQSAIPFDETMQAKLHEAIDEEASHFGQPTATEDPVLQNMARSFAQNRGVSSRVDLDRFRFFEAIQAAILEHLQRRSMQLAGQPAASINPVFPSIGEEEQKSGPTMTEAIADFLSAPARQNNADKTKRSNEAKLLVLAELLGADRNVSEISRADIRTYVEQLSKLPANAKQRFARMSANQAIEAASRVGDPSLSPKSIKLYLDAAKSLFKWLVQEEYIDRNPAIGIEGPAISKQDARRPLTEDELLRLLSSTAPNQGEEEDWKFWSVRCCLLHGFRFSEPLGLKVGDLKQIDGVWVFDLKPNEVRSLKTSETQRMVPVHPELLRLGICKLKEGKGDHELLIDGIPFSADRSMNRAQKSMMAHIRKHISTDKTAVFHSLRHNFRDELREICAPPDIATKLGGWKPEGSQSMASYGSGASMRLLADWIEKVRYGELLS